MEAVGGLRVQRDGRSAVRVLARARLFVTPAFLLLAFFQPRAPVAPLVVLTVLGCAWVATTSWLVLCTPRVPAAAAIAAGDLLVLSAASFLTDDANSLYPFLALLGLCALPPILPTRQRALFYLAFAVLVGGPVLGHNLDGGGFPVESLTFFGGLSIAYEIARRGAEVEFEYVGQLDALLDDRSRLLDAASELAEHQRRRSAQDLHDAVLQTLLAAGQDLDEAAETHNDEDLARGREAVRASIGALRSAVTELHPSSLAGTRLPSAVAALAEHHRKHGAQITTTIDPGASGPHDDALFAVARELIDDAIGQAGPGAVAITLAREDGAIVVEITAGPSGPDTGVDPDRAAMAAVAIAWSAARLRSAGGSLDVRLSRDQGSRSRASAPLA